MKKLADAGDAKQVALLRKEQSKPSETITAKTITKSMQGDKGATKFFDMLVEKYGEEDEVNMLELMINLTKEHSLWFSQVHESLYTCKYLSQFAKVAPFLINSIQDRHLRFAIAAQASSQGDEAILQYLTSMRDKMGGNSMYFSCFNPNGRYKLDLGNPVQRDIAKQLMVINKRVNEKIVAKECCDRSQIGNQSCFRNEKINKAGFAMHPHLWRLPERGIFEFDF